MRVVYVATPQQRIRYAVVDDHGETVEVIRSYLQHLHDRGYARNSLKASAQGLCLYFRFLHENAFDYRAVRIAERAAFVAWLKRPGAPRESASASGAPGRRKDRTINQYLGVVTGFYDWLWRTEQIERNVNDLLRGAGAYRPYKGFLHHLGAQPVERNILTQPIPRQQHPRVLNKAEVATLRDAARSGRDRALVLLIFETGLRPGEVLALWLDDIHIGENVIAVVDRGELPNRAEIKRPTAERRIHVSQDLINELLAYVTAAHTDDITTRHVFLIEHGPRRGEPMTYDDLRAVFLRLSERSGIDASPYTLRHTSLTLLAKANWSPDRLQLRAGHRHFQTTVDTYVHLDDDDLRAEWERTRSAEAFVLKESDR